PFGRVVMLHLNRLHISRRRLLLFKWLMVFLPFGTVALGHSLLEHAWGGAHSGGGTNTLLPTLFVSLLGLALTSLFVETLFRLLWDSRRRSWLASRMSRPCAP